MLIPLLPKCVATALSRQEKKLLLGSNRIGMVSCIMRRHILRSLGLVLVLAVFYEIAFRLVTASCGEVKWATWPPCVYYVHDTDSFPWRLMCFGFRSRLPFGKVRLSKGSEFYVDGSRFYRRGADGGFDDMTDWMAATLKRKP